MTSVKYINGLRNYAGCLCIVPLNSPNKITSFLHVLNGLLVISLVVIAAIDYPSFMNGISRYDTTIQVGFTLATLIGILANLFQLIRINIIGRKEFVAFILELESMEEPLLQHRNSKFDTRNKVRFYIEAIIVHCSVIAYFLNGLIHFLKHSPWYILHFVINEYFRYRLLFGMFLIRNYTILIGKHFGTLAEMLESINPHVGGGTLGGNVDLIKLKLIRSTFAKIAGLITTWNSIFGGFFFVLYVNVTLALLYMLNVASINGLSDNFERQNPSLALVLYAFYPLLLLYAMFDSCQEASGKMNAIPMIGTKLMANELDNPLLKELKLFMIQLSGNRLAFSAAGFFDVDYQMILPTVTMVLSYFITLVQFKD